MNSKNTYEVSLVVAKTYLVEAPNREGAINEAFDLLDVEWHHTLGDPAWRVVDYVEVVDQAQEAT